MPKASRHAINAWWSSGVQHPDMRTKWKEIILRPIPKRRVLWKYMEQPCFPMKSDSPEKSNTIQKTARQNNNPTKTNAILSIHKFDGQGGLAHSHNVMRLREGLGHHGVRRGYGELHRNATFAFGVLNGFHKDRITASPLLSCENSNHRVLGGGRCCQAI